jgi:hypothetical protein
MADTGTNTNTNTNTAPVPSPIFSPEDPLNDLWVRAYQGEVLGEALFANIAENLGDPEQARKMRVLSKLEQRTKEAIAPSLARAGIDTEPDPEMFTLADALSQGIEWEAFLQATQSITEQYIPLYQRIGELDPSERAASDLLVAHEAALRAFARAEVAGDTENSLDAINTLAHMA